MNVFRIFVMFLHLSMSATVTNLFSSLPFQSCSSCSDLLQLESPPQACEFLQYDPTASSTVYSSTCHEHFATDPSSSLPFQSCSTCADLLQTLDFPLQACGFQQYDPTANSTVCCPICHNSSLGSFVPGNHQELQINPLVSGGESHQFLLHRLYTFLTHFLHFSVWLFRLASILAGEFTVSVVHCYFEASLWLSFDQISIIVWMASFSVGYVLLRWQSDVSRFIMLAPALLYIPAPIQLLSAFVDVFLRSLHSIYGFYRLASYAYSGLQFAGLVVLSLLPLLVVCANAEFRLRTVFCFCVTACVAALGSVFLSSYIISLSALSLTISVAVFSAVWDFCFQVLFNMPTEYVLGWRSPQRYRYPKRVLSHCRRHSDFLCLPLAFLVFLSFPVTVSAKVSELHGSLRGSLPSSGAFLHLASSAGQFSHACLFLSVFSALVLSTMGAIRAYSSERDGKRRCPQLKYHSPGSSERLPAFKIWYRQMILFLKTKDNCHVLLDQTITSATLDAEKECCDDGDVGNPCWRGFGQLCTPAPCI